LISIRDLTVEYRGGHRGIEKVSIKIPTDRVTCIIGPNGAGKSTLLKAIAKIVPYNGYVYLDGLEVSSTPLKTVSRMVSYASQIHSHELLSLSVLEALLVSRYPVSKGFVEGAEDYRSVYNIAREMMIEHLLERRIAELSSGELQRVIIAMALAKDPRYLLFDELDAHVDVGVKAMLSKLIKKWSINKVVVFTTQDILFGVTNGDYFILLDRGRVVFTGNKKDLLSRLGIIEKVYHVKIARYKYSDLDLIVPIYTS